MHVCALYVHDNVLVPITMYGWRLFVVLQEVQCLQTCCLDVVCQTSCSVVLQSMKFMTSRFGKILTFMCPYYNVLLEAIFCL